MLKTLESLGLTPSEQLFEIMSLAVPVARLRRRTEDQKPKVTRTSLLCAAILVDDQVTSLLKSAGLDLSLWEGEVGLHGLMVNEVFSEASRDRDLDLEVSALRKSISGHAEAWADRPVDGLALAYAFVTARDVGRLPAHLKAAGVDLGLAEELFREALSEEAPSSAGSAREEAQAASSPRIVGLEGLEPHVGQALHLAWSNAQPVAAADAFLALTRIESSSRAFGALRDICKGRGVELPEPSPQPDTPAGPIRLTQSFARAIDIARSASPDRSTVWGRTLITALLFGPESLEPLLGEGQREWLREDWQEFLREEDPDHEWDAAIEQLRALRPAGPQDSAMAEPSWPAIRFGRLARYAADTGKSHEDQLGIDTDVEAMAAVIASTDIEPPLSIGLFGHWGSGKTFFMERLDEEIQMRARAARQEREREERERQPPKKLPFVAQIAPIWFNAWHFMDANLWPSLVVRIFEGLAEHMGPKDKIDEARQRLLREARLAQHELEAAQGEQQAKEVACNTERERVKALEAWIQEASEETEERNPWDAVKQRRVGRRLLEEVATSLKLQVDGEDVTWSQIQGRIRHALEEMQGLRRRLMALLDGCFPETHFYRGLALTGLAAVAIAVAVFQWKGGDWGRLWGLLASASAGLSTAAAGVVKKADDARRIAGRLNRRLAVVDDVVEAAGTEEQRRVEAANERLRQLLEERDRGRTRVLELEEQARAAQARLDEARAGRLLERFIQGRIESSDYRQNLGVISMIREDFERLMRHFEDVRRNRAKGELPAIDRIVLFVDDLDRCPRRRVVEVLQAVHLLLALKLFVVVVAVDPRWLRDSLACAETLELHVDPETVDSSEATPLNYLEKIFQIPYTLKPMGAKGYADYVTYLTRPREGEAGRGESDGEQEESPPKSPTGIRGGTDDTSAGEEELRHPEPGYAGDAGTGAGAGALPPDAGSPQPEPAAGSQPPQSMPASTASSEPELSKEDVDRLLGTTSLDLKPQERDFIAALGPPMIRTPRAAKRLVNCYLFLRATLEEPDLETFTGDSPPEYAGALLLLALATGRPPLAARTFEKLELLAESDRHHTRTILASVLREEQEPQLLAWLGKLGDPLGSMRATVLKELLPRDRKFTFVIEPTAGHQQNGEAGGEPEQ